MEISLLLVARQLLLFAHLILFAFAFVYIAREDLALSRGQLDHSRLRAISVTVMPLLAGLWITGLILVWFDGGFNYEALLTKPKLLAKLTVVAVLTANGALLHMFAFPGLCERSIAGPAVLWVALGAVSTASWLFAAFLGVGRLIAPVMSYQSFLSVYALVLSVAVAIAITVVGPRLTAASMRGARPITGGER